MLNVIGFGYAFILLICFMPFVSAHADLIGDPVKGQELYKACAVCHGQNAEGLRATNSPRLNSLLDTYLIGQLEKFRTGLRGANAEDRFGVQMVPAAQSFPDKQAILDVVAYIVTLQSEQPSRTELSGDVEKGSRDYQDCGVCHGLKAQGFKTLGTDMLGYEVPRLAGQHDWYLIRQTENYRSGVRGHPDDKAATQMRVRAKVLLRDDQTIRDIVAYIGTLE